MPGGGFAADSPLKLRARELGPGGKSDEAIEKARADGLESPGQYLTPPRARVESVIRNGSKRAARENTRAVEVLRTKAGDRRGDEAKLIERQVRYSDVTIGAQRGSFAQWFNSDEAAKQRGIRRARTRDREILEIDGHGGATGCFME